VENDFLGVLVIVIRHKCHGVLFRNFLSIECSLFYLEDSVRCERTIHWLVVFDRLVVGLSRGCRLPDNFCEESLVLTWVALKICRRTSLRLLRSHTSKWILTSFKACLRVVSTTSK